MLTKEQSVLKSVMDAFEGGNMPTQYSVLCYRIDLYFYDYRLAVEIDEKGHKDRIIDHEIQRQRQKALGKKLGCKFIRINTDEGKFNIFMTINEIHRHIKESTKKSTRKAVINDVRLGMEELSLEFEKNTKTIHNFVRRAFKHVVPKPLKILRSL